MKLIQLVLVAVLLTACGASDPRPSPLGGDRQAEVPAGCASGGGTAHIDWVNFVKFEGIMYNGDGAHGPLDKSDLGPVFDETRCEISDNVTDPEYDTRDGDAAYLSPGTPLYEVKGYDPSFRLAAKWRGEWVLYEADTAPGAERGSDLLDIEGKVRFITVNSPKDAETVLGEIRDEAEVEELVEMVLDSPVDQSRQANNEDMRRQLFVEFHLEDGTSVNRALFPATEVLSRGILVPEEFVTTIESAAKNS